MAHAVTGKAGAVTIGAGGVASNFKLTSWGLTVSSKEVDGSGSGDTWTDRVPIRSDWEATMEGYAMDQATWDLGQDLVGTEAACSLKRKSTDTNPYFTDTGLVTGFELNHPHDGYSTVKLTVKSSDGSAGPTFDTTPAT